MSEKDINEGLFLQKLGFYNPEGFTWRWVLSNEQNVIVNTDNKTMGIILFEGNGNYYTSHDISIEDGNKFLRENITKLKQFDKKPNKDLGNKLAKIANSFKKVDESPVKTRFKNIWFEFGYRTPPKATKGILYSVPRKEYEPLCKKVNSLVSKAFKSENLLVHGQFNDAIFCHYQPTSKLMKESLKIPYISKLYKENLKDANDEEDLEKIKKQDLGLGIDTVVFKGKYKGVGTDASLYYFAVVVGFWEVEDVTHPSIAIEVITPIDKGEDFFLNEVKGAVSKLNIWKFSGKKIYVNKCPKAVTGSAESKVFAYKGQIITANSKEEAIQKIVATKRFKKGDKVGISLKILYDSTKKHKTDFGYTIDTSEKGYYDLKDKFGNIVCMDGEVCTVKTVSKLGDIIFTNNDSEEETSFTLSKKEVDTCVG